MRSSGNEIGKNIIRDGKNITAVVAGNDLIALGIIDEYKAAGYKIPEDLAIVGYDNIEMGKRNAEPLSTVKQDIEIIAKQLLILL